MMGVKVWLKIAMIMLDNQANKKVYNIKSVINGRISFLNNILILWATELKLPAPTRIHVASRKFGKTVFKCFLLSSGTSNVH